MIICAKWILTHKLTIADVDDVRLYAQLDQNDHLASMGIEPTTFALLARRSNQLS